MVEDDDLDDLSNSVIDLINEGRLDDAEERCRELQDRYPDLIDWRMRFAAVYEARKDWMRAAEYYVQAADFAERTGFPQEAVGEFRASANRLEEKARE